MKALNYLKDTKGEMKHVNWPTRSQVIFFTVIVVSISLLTAALLGFFDFVFTYLLEVFVF